MGWVLLFLIGLLIIVLVAQIMKQNEEGNNELKNKVNNTYQRTPIGTSNQIITNIAPTQKTKQALSIIDELTSMYNRKSYDEARLYLQKIAYGMVGDDVSEEDKKDFKQIMTVFADHDPLYHELIRKAYPIIEAEEGILQSKIYPYLPEYSQETVRYVLYFAHELGDIKRVKKGRSYMLYPNQGKVIS